MTYSWIPDLFPQGPLAGAASPAPSTWVCLIVEYALMLTIMTAVASQQSCIAGQYPQPKDLDACGGN